MSSEPMELAKNWDETKWKKFLPAYAQVKYDGVPLTFIRMAPGGPEPAEGDPDYRGKVVALTRQNEVTHSVQHLLDFAEMLLLIPGASFTAECLVPGLPFKESSGIIRRTTPDEDTAKIIGIAFDYNRMAHPKETYYIRRKQWETAMAALSVAYTVHDRKLPIATAPIYATCHTPEAVERAWADIASRIKNPEGMMLHSLTKPFMPGKRCWGMGRYKPQPTIDLEVMRYVEAVSDDGEPLGMLGRVEVLLRRVGRADSEVGIGPGKLTHDERRAVWQAANPILASGLGPRKPVVRTFAEIKYMPDPSYDALRQPTVQRLRTDKTEGDILEY